MSMIRSDSFVCLIFIVFLAVLLKIIFYPGEDDSISHHSTSISTNRVLILGATGQQGQGAIEIFLKYNEIQEDPNKKWKIRAMTRNIASLSSKKLKEKGIEVVQGDLSDENEDNLVHAMNGCSSIFAMTFSDFEDGKEMDQGLRLYRVLARSEVKSMVFSGGEQTNRSFLNIKYDIEQNLRRLQLPFHVYLHTVFFYENVVVKHGDQRIQLEEDGSILFSTPLPGDLKIPMISAYDIGRIAATILLNTSLVESGSSIPISGDVVSCNDFARIFTSVVGMNASFQTTPLEEFEKRSFPGASKIADMYRWYIEEGHFRDPSITKSIYPNTLSLEDWMKCCGAPLITSQIKPKEQID